MEKKPQKVVTLTEQINQFRMIQNYLTAAMGEESKDEFLSNSVFFISIGSNDLFGYYYSNSTIPKPDFMATLAYTYESSLKV